MAIKAFIKKQPVLTYYALAFAISWGAILVLVGPGAGRGGRPDARPPAWRGAPTRVRLRGVAPRT